MADRKVKVELILDPSPYIAGLAKAATATRGLSGDVEKTVRQSAPRLRKEGERAGGALAQGVQMGLVRNSPLIAAGIGGALAAGAPAVLAGAGVMFAGIGALAAAQTEEVKEAWTDLGRSIREGAVEDAAVLVPTFTRMAGQIGESFQRMRPLLRDAFGALAPQLETLVGSLLNAAETAVPALVRAVERGKPVMDGLASLIENIGAGLADFMDAISEHAGAAGTALDSIGQIVGELLPILGELLGQGVELASAVLPPLASALGAVADALEVLGPALPVVVGGFAAFKGVSAVNGILETLVGKLGDARVKLSAFAQEPGPAIKSVGALKGAMGGLGAGLGLLATSYMLAKQQTDEWAQALLEGGDAAEQARAQMALWESTLSEGTLGLGLSATGVTNWATAVGIGTNATETAEEAARKLWAAMTPLDQAQSKVTSSRDALNIALQKDDATGAATALGNYEKASALVEQQEAETQMAISGVTQAMIDQANQAIAATNSSFAFRLAQDGVQQAEEDLAVAIRDHGAASEEASDAGLAFEQALLQQATAAGQLAADALPATASELDRNRASTEGTLSELYKLRNEMGSAFPASLQTTIANLEAAGTGMNKTAEKAAGLTQSVSNIPTGKAIKIAMETGVAKDQLKAFLNGIPVSRTIALQIKGKGGFASGGYTGDGGRYEAAGIVHRREYVVPAPVVDRIGPHGVEARLGLKGYANGGLVGGREVSAAAAGGYGAGSVNVAAPQVKVYLDGQEWRGIARVEVDNALGSMADQQLYAGT